MASDTLRKEDALAGKISLTSLSEASSSESLEPDKDGIRPLRSSISDTEEGLDPDFPLETSETSVGTAILLTLLPLKTIASVIWNSGVMCMVVSSAIQSLSALLVKMTDGRVPIFEIVTVRSSICMAATFVMIRLQGLPHILGGMEYIKAKFVRGFAGAVSMSIYYYAVFKLSLSDTVTIFFTHPAMIVFLAWIVRGEAVRWTGLLGVLLSMIGVVFVAKPPFLFGGAHWTPDHISGVLACLAAAFTAAIAFIAVRFIPKSVPSVCVAAWFHFMGLLTAGIPLAMGIPEWPVLPSLADSARVVGVGFCSFTSHVLIARSLQIETAAKASAAGYLQVVFAYLYGLAFLGEAVQLVSVAGSLVICVGVLATSWPRKAETDDRLPVVHKVSDPTYELVSIAEEAPSHSGSPRTKTHTMVLPTETPPSINTELPESKHPTRVAAPIASEGMSK